MTDALQDSMNVVGDIVMGLMSFHDEDILMDSNKMKDEKTGLEFPHIGMNDHGTLLGYDMNHDGGSSHDSSLGDMMNYDMYHYDGTSCLSLVGKICHIFSLGLEMMTWDDLTT